MQRAHLTLSLLGLVALAAMLQSQRPAEYAAKPSSALILPQLEAAPADVPLSHAALGDLQVRITPDQTRWVSGSGDRFIVIELEAREGASPRALPVDLSLVLDTSCSMADHERLAQAKVAASRIVQAMGPEDDLALVHFDGEARTLRPLGARVDLERDLGLISGLQIGGGTALYAGLRMGAQQLSDSPPEALRRVVLLSDGEPTVGPADARSLARAAAGIAQEGSTVSALGLGLGFDIETMMAIADAGGGRYHYVEDPNAVAEMFEEELRQLRGTLARQVRVRIDGVDVVEIAEVYGYEEWDGERTPFGYEVFVGDVAADQPRKVVARVRPAQGRPGPVNLANVSVSFTDPLTGEAHTTRLPVQGEIVDDEALASASVQADAGERVMRALAGRSLAQAVATRTTGDAAGARRSLQDGWSELERMERRYGRSMSTEKARLRELDGQYAQPLEAEDLERLRALGYLSALGYME